MTETFSAAAPFWVTFALALALCRLRPGFLFFVSVFPGTVAHEFAHFVVALVLSGRPEAPKVYPVKTEEGWTLGSVAFRPNWWNGTFVALAPLLLIPLAYELYRLAGLASSTSQLIYGYIAGASLFAAIPSRADWLIAFRYPAGILLLALASAGMRHLA